MLAVDTGLVEEWLSEFKVIYYLSIRVSAMELTCYQSLMQQESETGLHTLEIHL